VRLFDFDVPTIEQSEQVNDQHNTGPYMIIGRGRINQTQGISDVPGLVGFVTKLWVILVDIQGEEGGLDGRVGIYHLFKWLSITFNER
jgi:hypothetical protein